MSSIQTPRLGDIHTLHGRKRKRALYETSSYHRAQRDHSSSPSPWAPVSLKDYRLDEQEDLIGEGTFGNVYKALAPSGKQVALKLVRRDNDRDTQWRDGFPITAIREIKILKALDHPNILPLMDVVTDYNNDMKEPRVYMVFEYMDHDLAGLMANDQITFQEEHIKHYMQQILEGLYYCHHKCNVLHRDIKGSNVLINSNGEVKLADFGLARLFQPTQNREYTARVVTLWYRAPELLLGLKKYGPAIDMWSVGCVFAEMIFSRPTFPAATEIEAIEEICKLLGTPTEDTWPGITELQKSSGGVEITRKFKRTMEIRYKKLKDKFPLAFDLLSKLLVMCPEQRLTAKQALEHDYFHKDPLPKPPPMLNCKPSHEYEIRKDRYDRKDRQRKKMMREREALRSRDQKQYKERGKDH